MTPKIPESEAGLFGFVTLNDWSALPPSGGGTGGVRIVAKFASCVLLVQTGDRSAVSTRRLQLCPDEEVWVRSDTVGRVRLDEVGTSATGVAGQVFWAWAAASAAAGDGAALLSGPILNVLTPVPPGAYEVELYRSGAPGNWTWSVQTTAAPLVFPTFPLPASPSRYYVGGTHYLSTATGVAVWRLRSL